MARQVFERVSVYGEREDTPEKRLKDKDKKRAAYYDYYTDMRFGDGRDVGIIRRQI